MNYLKNIKKNERVQKIVDEFTDQQRLLTALQDYNCEMIDTTECDWQAILEIGAKMQRVAQSKRTVPFYVEIEYSVLVFALTPQEWTELIEVLEYYPMRRNDE